MNRSRLERALTPLLGLLLFLQAGIVVTGGAVRLTGSGLGCPTWPECTHGSIAPVAHQAQGAFHSWIEFGNRLLTFLLIAASIAVLAAVIKLKRRDIKKLAIWQLLGILAQIPLGGITVLTHLNPIPVAAHFLLSIALIAAGTSLFERRTFSPAAISSNPSVLVGIHTILAATVIMVGTVVTGSGPNAGDISAPRFNIKIDTVAWIHAGLVIALILFSLFLFTQSSHNVLLRKRIITFLGFSLAQGCVGFLQYYQGLPELLVGIHLLGVTLVWISAWRIHLAAKIG